MTAASIPSPGRLDVLVVGGGPAGLAAAIELRRLGAGRVLVAEREQALGGIARHSTHTGYGLRDLHRLMSGPAYAAQYTRLAERAGVELAVSTTVSSLTALPDGIHAVLDASGAVSAFAPTAVVVATGTRERPRSARLIPGERPAGVYTTGALQQLVLSGRFRGGQAVIIGAEHVSFSAVLTLAHARCRTVAIVTSERHHQTYAPLSWAVAGVRRIPILARRDVVGIVGQGRVTGVVVRQPGGPLEQLACDTVIVSGDWVPDHELARRSGLPVDRGNLAPFVDGLLRLERPGWFAAGNLLHGAETADACARDGRHVARSIAAWLDDPRAARWAYPGVPAVADPPFQWVFPNRLRPGDLPPRGRILLRVAPSSGTALDRLRADLTPARAADLDVTEPDSARHSKRHVEILQGARMLWRGRAQGAVGPNRTCWIPSDWLDSISVDDPIEPIRVRLT